MLDAKPRSSFRVQTLAISVVGALGLLLVGIALGLLYWDQHSLAIAIHNHKVTTGQVTDGDGLVSVDQSFQRWLGALATGSIGAACVGFACFMALLSIFSLRAMSGARPPGL